MHARWAVQIAIAGLVCAPLTGCSSATSGSGATDGKEGGGVVTGPLLTSLGTSEEGMFAGISGRLSFRGGCLRLRGMPVVWPEGTTWAPPDVLTLPNGDVVAMGDRVEGGGGYLDLDAVTKAFGEEVGKEAQRCLGETAEIAVFNLGWEVDRVG